MIFTPLPLPGAFLIDLEPRGDERGFFARVFCEKEFSAHGLETKFLQINNSVSALPGTLRGMHYQLPESAEVKLVRCVRGALFDVMVDLRPHSPAFKKWFGLELSADNRRMVYVPRGFAHGFITMEPQTEVFYLASAFYDPKAERGVRYDDPAIGIQWPFSVAEISKKDSQWPDLNEKFHGFSQLQKCE